ncbi:Cystathionine beta-synthase, partial [Phytophthora palmivora]
NYSKYRKETGTWWSEQRVSVLELPHPSTVTPQLSCAAAIETMEHHGYDQLPVVKENGTVQGVVTIGNLLSMLSSGRVSRTDPVAAVTFGNFSRVTHESSLAELATIFDKDYFAVVTSIDGKIAGLATRIDLLNYITSATKE